METILKIDNIEKYYGNKSSLTKAIDNISFEVGKGEFVSIMGASGSGKTTLLNCISTLDKVTTGKIYVGGNEITQLKGNKLNKFRREELGFIFQDFNLLDTLTAFENIALALTIMKVPAKEIEDRVRSIAEKLMITEVLNKYPYLYDLAKDCWVPVERELHCYRNEFDTGKGYYYFTDKYQNRVLPVLSPDGKVRFKSMKKKSFRKGRLADPAKAAKLREQYPELYANRDFKFDRSRFTARIGQELFSIKKEDYHDRSI